MVNCLAVPGMIVVWIIYWVKISGYSNMLGDRGRRRREDDFDDRFGGRDRGRDSDDDPDR